MEPTDIVPAIIVLLAANIVCIFLGSSIKIHSNNDRFISIDGLRGYLALGVFIHHAAVWYFYLKKGVWEPPPSNFYTHLGQSSVSLFFMITGLLFYSKILGGRSNPIDWLRLYVSRILRLTPLYLLAILSLLVIVMALSDWQVQLPLSSIAVQVAKWLGFAIIGAPDINGVPNTSLIMAGVVWTLRYEWVFYALLPVLAMLSSVRVGWVYFILSIGTFLAVLAVGFSVVYWLPFLGGIFAAIAIRFDKLRSALCTPIASVVAIMAVVALLWFYPTGFGLAQTMLIAAAFLIVASGNEMFGLLSGRLSRILGEMSYGIYLLHGLLLFITFRFVIGFDVAKSFDPITHWLVIIGLTPILIVISAISYLKVERPAMSQTRVVANWLNSRLGKQSN